MTSIEAQQSPGNLSGAATSEIFVARARSRALHHIDFGNGLKSEWWMKGDVGVCPPHFANRVLVEADHRVQIIAIPLTELDELAGERGEFGTLHDRTPATPQLNRLMDRCFRAEADVMSDLQGAELALAIFTELGRMRGRRRRTDRVPESLPPHRLRLAIERLLATGLPPARLVDLAALCDLSPSHFCRAFHAQTGLPPHRYALVQCMKRARALLREDELSIAEIAHQLGYDDAAYFSRSFARETGLSPSAWRSAKR